MSADPVWGSLVPAAMVGTERHALPKPALPGPVGELLHGVSAGDAATGLLRMAAVLAPCELAGVQGRPWSAPLPPPAGAETRPAPTDTALLAWSLRRGPGRLQHQVLAALDAQGLRLPTALLPLALELGRHSIALRTPLQPVLGARGLWLATQNADWRFAIGAAAEAGDELRWAEGSLDQRRALLRAQRRRDPAGARERLAAALAELPARERAELLGTLWTGLSMDDEPLLDGLRSDRSREVRQVVVALLVGLPDSALARQAIARATPLLQPRWTIDAPADAPPDADGIDPVRPKHESLGDRAWWLYQLLRQVPLGWWPRHTGLSPAELLPWALATDWSEAIVRAWRDLLSNDPPVDWCEALLDHWPAKLLRDDPASVLALLPPARRERHLERQLRGGTVSLAVSISQVLQACPIGESLSPALSTTVADALLDAARRNVFLTDHGLRGQLPELACVLHPEVLARLDAWPRHADETPSLVDLLNTMAQVTAARRALSA